LKNIKDYIFQEKRQLLAESEQSRCYFLDAASYNNLGDQAIALAMTYFLSDIFGEERLVVVNENDLIRQFRSIKAEIKPNDVIALSGGGNMGDKYPRYEAIRRKIIKAFPDNNIVLFPQTVDYTHDRYGRREFNRAKSTYSKHKKLVICAREKRSFEIMKEIRKDALLVPDIVFYLKGKIDQNGYKVNYNTIGLCLRDDLESNIKDVDGIRSNIDSSGRKVVMMSTISRFTSSEKRQAIVESKIKEFGECEIIITDRLHGVIFSYISGSTCIALDNINHKVFEVIDYCLKDSNMVKKCSNIDELNKLINNQKSEIDNCNIQYDNLVRAII